MLLYAAAGLALVLSLLLALLTGALGLHGTPLLLTRLLVGLFGLAAAAALVWFAQRKKKPAAGDDGKPVDTAALDDLLAGADRRLAASGKAGVKHLRDLPILYLLGDSGSAKTTVAVKSGLEPELLAGEVYRERDIVPTGVANLWYSGKTALVEAGEAVRRQPALWAHLVARTQPAAFAAARRPAPFRAAVVCVSAEQFTGAQTAESMEAAAAGLNGQLRELARQLGANVPAYVLITKLDRVPGFAEYVRNLTPEEGTALLGAAPAPLDSAAASSTEAALAAVTGALDAVLFSLGAARLDLLARETDPQRLAPAYQFPRELRRFRRPLSTWLVALNRRSQLSTFPDLRAFCFTGVRPITVQQVAAAAEPVAARATFASDATGVFQSPLTAAAPVPQLAPAAFGEKVAQWTFLPRFFAEVVLRDEAALRLTGHTGSGRLLRRLVYGGAALLLLLYLGLLTGSYFANSALESRVETAAATLAQTTPAQPSANELSQTPAAADASTATVTTAQLQALDNLRASLVELDAYQAHGAPLVYRWGLYRGDSLLPPTRALYLQHFRSLLLARTQGELASSLGALPSPAQPAATRTGAAPSPTAQSAATQSATAPAADYNTTYAALRAYLITTSNPDKSTVDFLSPVLLRHLQNTGVATAPQDSALAARQFDYYAALLPTGNPYATAPATAAVARARTYLAGFGGFERIYQSILTAAEKTAPAVRFAAQFPNSVGVLDEPHTIPGAFTKPGYSFVQEAVAHPDRYFRGESWVLGDQAPQSIDTAALHGQLATRYAADYRAQWSAFLRDAAVVRYTGLPDAGKKLDILSKNDSPLLALLLTVSRNTAVADTAVQAAFQAPAAVVPPGSVDQYIVPANKPYVDSLLALAAAVNGAASGTSAGAANPAAGAGTAAAPDPSAASINTAAAAASLAAQQLAQTFRIDARDHLDAATLALLRQPITAAESLARGAAAAPTNAGGKSLCGTVNALANKVPFNPRGTEQATPAELAALLAPSTGSLWQLYNASLKPLLVPQGNTGQQGSTYAAAPGAAVNPAFLRFFNRMAGLSAALFPANAKDPQFTFTLHTLPSPGVQSSVFKVDAQSLTNADTEKQFTWNGSTAAQASLTANGLPLGFTGPWAVFQLVGKARVQKSSGSGYDLSFPLELANTPVRAADGTPTVVRYQLAGPGADLLVPGGFAGTHCVAEITK